MNFFLISMIIIFCVVKPELQKGPQWRKVASRGDGSTTAELVCRAEGIPRIDFSWEKKGVFLDLANPRSETALTLLSPFVLVLLWHSFRKNFRTADFMCHMWLSFVLSFDSALSPFFLVHVWVLLLQVWGENSEGGLLPHQHTASSKRERSDGLCRLQLLCSQLTRGRQGGHPACQHKYSICIPFVFVYECLHATGRFAPHNPLSVFCKKPGNLPNILTFHELEKKSSGLVKYQSFF